MLLTLQRTMRTDRYTMGTLAIDGTPFCHTLEPVDRQLTSTTITLQQKVVGQTAIPTGTYPILLSYSPRFKRTLPQLFSVPCFAGIRIHAGNTVADTSGCILVGRYLSPGRLCDSRATVAQLIKRLSSCTSDNLPSIEVRA